MEVSAKQETNSIYRSEQDHILGKCNMILK